MSLSVVCVLPTFVPVAVIKRERIHNSYTFFDTIIVEINR